MEESAEWSRSAVGAESEGLGASCHSKQLGAAGRKGRGTRHLFAELGSAGSWAKRCRMITEGGAVVLANMVLGVCQDCGGDGR
jgi:hypothetical protein